MLPAASRPRTPLHRHVLIVAVAALCLAALLGGCGTATGASLRTPGVTAAPTSTIVLGATPTSVPTPALTVLRAAGPPVAGTNAIWRHANLPAGFGMAFHESDLHVAASDGRRAYSCGASAGAARPQVIVTHDGGASWTRVADIPGQWDGCQSLTVDALNPAIVVACCGSSASGFVQAISLDGGASWRLDAEPRGAVIFQLATRGSRTYAMFGDTDGSGNMTLATSDDHLQTWHAIDTGLTTSNYRAFWLNPASGALLLESWPGGGAFQLWRSDDGGGHWSQMAVPEAGVGEFTAQQPSGAMPWHICGSVPASGAASPDSFICTSDGGRTWTQEPLLIPGSAASYAEQLVGLPPDGSLLATVSSGEGATLYRLPAGATRWQALGRLPEGSDGGCAYASTLGGGMLWTFPAESDGASNPDSPTAVYSAAYPY